jgi:hypothetical protein
VPQVPSRTEDPTNYVLNLSQQLMDNVASHIGQAKISTIEPIGEFHMVDSQQV